MTRAGGDLWGPALTRSFAYPKQMSHPQSSGRNDPADFNFNSDSNSSKWRNRFHEICLDFTVVLHFGEEKSSSFHGLGLS